jgi:hypothetical protein
MGQIKGAKEFLAWKDGKPLSRKQSMLAHCFSCNGEEEGAEDCLGAKNCVLYPYFYYKGKKRQIIPIKQEKSNLGTKNASFMANRSAEDGV